MKLPWKADKKSPDIEEIASKARAFSGRLEKVKSRLKQCHWYPYDSLAAFDHLDRLLHDERRCLLDLAGGKPVLDIGCGDGAVAFFLESLGCRVVAVDHPVTNWNQMRGVTLLKQALGSEVEIRTADLDSQFTLGGQAYGIALALGVLYHLKNPFYLLSTLAKSSSYALVSTRIARYTPDRQVDFRGQPMAYLVDESETNNDSTNFWIFSEAGLQRLFKRAGWDVCDFMTVGNTARSDPVSEAGDERAFALLRSRITDPRCDLLKGWHELEYDAWRWTERDFSLAFRASAGRATVRMRFALPPSSIGSLGPVTIAASANGVPVAAETYAEAGEHEYVRALPQEALESETIRIDFRLDKALPPDAGDARERGIVVLSVELD